MSFWSGETLRARLPDLVSPFNSSQIDCSSYTLTACNASIHTRKANAAIAVAEPLGRCADCWPDGMPAH
jgi:hypothetical protein